MLVILILAKHHWYNAANERKLPFSSHLPLLTLMAALLCYQV